MNTKIDTKIWSVDGFAIYFIHPHVAIPALGE